jgi:RNA polymerase sigma-70 factor (ECF subfamily)
MLKPSASVFAAPAPGTSPEPSSGELLLRTFNDLRDELVSTLLFLLGNQEDAQDMAQEAFLRCWRIRESLPAIQNLRAWIFRVGLNAAKDLQRSAWSRRVKPQLAADVVPPVAKTPAQALEEKELVAKVRSALKHLRPEEKEVFLLRQNGELTYQQIARLHSRPLGTVKTLMRSALQKLRELLNPEVPPRPGTAGRTPQAAGGCGAWSGRS